MHTASPSESNREPVLPLWRVVYQALENERSLDLHYRRIATSFPPDAKVPNYKVMKQIALRNRLGVLYGPAIWLATILIPLLAPFQWLGGLLRSLIGFAHASGARVHAIPTAPGNIVLIDAALALADNPDARDTDLMQGSRLAVGIGPSGVASCMLSHARLLWQCLSLPAGERRDMFLHARDAFLLLMLAHYARSHASHCFITDDHYQRWSYVLSHTASHFAIAQHGFLDPHIAFHNRFGQLHALYVRDESFTGQFAAYYRISEATVFAPLVLLTDNPFSDKALFLASSFPWIDQEITLVKAVRAKLNVPVIVKFHPSHTYDERKLQLAALASHVCVKTENPACKVFVSHSSFMEYDYRSKGIASFSIRRLNGVEPTVKAIVAALEKSNAMQ
jgi:hypothetical protein